MHAQQDATAAALRASGHQCVGLTVTTIARTVIGIGNAGVWETNLTMHPLFGVPIIPTSALRSLARRGREVVTDDSTLADDAIALLGDLGRAGSVLPLGLIPRRGMSLECDVMTPHYGGYYSGTNVLPSETSLDPKPITFLTIKPGTTFTGFLLARPTPSRSVAATLALLETLARCVAEGGAQLGVGAKTTRGYGELATTHTIVP